MSAPTPGPWAVHRDFAFIVAPADHATRAVGAAVDEVFDRDHFAQEIARAEAATTLIADYQPSAGEDDDERVEVRLGDLKALRAAIAKAEGRS